MSRKIAFFDIDGTLTSEIDALFLLMQLLRFVRHVTMGI